MKRIERRLLTAIAVAQSGEPELLDNYLYTLALDKAQRCLLAAAVRTLAERLAALGHLSPFAGRAP